MANFLTNHAYLLAILASFSGVLLLVRSQVSGITSGDIIRVIGLTVPLFLVFDFIGAARGWFSSSPRYNSLIVQPGIPIEEPVLLSFLAVLSLALWRAIRQTRHA